MLSRTAACVYWMSRQMERAENIARVLDVSSQMALMPGGVGREQVLAPLAITGMRDTFMASGVRATADEILLFFTLNPNNPSSIYSCLRLARENGHVVRGKITAEMWESLNATWLEIQGMNRDKLRRMGASRFLDWVKERSHLFRGATFGTLQRNDAFHFARLGTFLERADNTARLLLVKAEAVATAAPGDASASDYYQWAALLRSLSAFESYRDIYRDSIVPAQVAEMLLFRPDLPRSLLACVTEITQTLGAIPGSSGLEAKRLAAQLHARLTYGHIGEALEEGLPQYLGQFLADINELGARIHGAYLEAA
ncbi:MAG TPA: alpha-E domain-containing protein [Moraxellaceae bacterium]|nr:alpha-E domain-containing protein [Moraxellaceae bacterium]